MNIHSTHSPLFGKAELKVDAPVSQFPPHFRKMDPNAFHDQKLFVAPNRLAQIHSTRKAILAPAIQVLAETLPDGLTLTLQSDSYKSPPVITVTKDGETLSPIPYQDFCFLSNGYEIWKRAIALVADRLKGKQPEKAALKVESSDQLSERLKARFKRAEAAIQSPKVQQLIEVLPDDMELILRATPEKQLEVVTRKNGEPFMPPIAQQTLGLNFDFQFDYLIWFNAVNIIKEQLELASTELEIPLKR